MKTAKEATSQLLKKLELLLNSLLKLLQIKYKKDSDAYNENVANEKKQQLNSAVYNIMRECAIDLHAALGSHGYPNLQKIINPLSIRNYNYKNVNGFIIYQYSLAKQSSERLPVVVLQNMKNNMNRDIAATNHAVMSEIGYTMMPDSFPYLVNGLYIVGIADVGEDVLISVASHYQPFAGLLA